MKTRHVLFSALTLVLATSCTAPEPQDELTELEISTITEEVEARVDDYFDAIYHRDLDLMLGFWADTEGFVIAGDG